MTKSSLMPAVVAENSGLNRAAEGVPIRVEGLTKSYELASGERLVVFADFNLTITGGTLTTILGPSGCGKSTLLRLIAGLESPEQGTIGIGQNSSRAVKPRVGFMLQQYPSLPWLTVIENVQLGVASRQRDRSSLGSFTERLEVERSRQEALRYLQRVGLHGWEDAYPRELSGGMLQRLALARTLAMQPDIVLLDEPLGALDALTRQELQMLIVDLHKSERATFVMVTHEVEEALAISDRVIVLGPVGTGVQYDTANSTSKLDREVLLHYLRGTHVTFAAGTWQGYAPVRQAAIERGRRVYEMWTGLSDKDRIEKLSCQGIVAGAFMTIQSLAQMQDRLAPIEPAVVHVFSETASAETAEQIFLAADARERGTWRWALPDGGLETAVIRQIDREAFPDRVVVMEDRASCVLAVAHGEADACVADTEFARRLLHWWQWRRLRREYLPEDIWKDLWSVLVVPRRLVEEQRDALRVAVQSLAIDASSVSKRMGGRIRYPDLEESRELLLSGRISQAFERWGGKDLPAMTVILDDKPGRGGEASTWGVNT